MYSSLVILLMIAAIASGCRSLGPTTVEKRGSKYLVVPNSKLLNNHIRVTEYVTGKKSGMLEAQIRGQNVSKKPIHFEYRFEWMDSDGAVLESQMSPWKPLMLQPRETCFMNGIASMPTATDFMFAVRFAQ